MRILVVTQYFRPEIFRINDLVDALNDKGHNITVLTGIPNYPTGQFFDGYSFKSMGSSDENEIKIKRVPLIPRGSGSKLRLSINYLSFLFFGCLFAPFSCRKKYDVIFVFGVSPITVAIPALLLKKLKKIPLMLWIQDLWPESLSATNSIQSKWILKSVRKLVDFIYRNCDQILIQSQGFRQHVLDADIEPERIKYLPNWAEETYRPLKYDSKLVELEKFPKGFVIMFAGNIGDAQSFDAIVEAASILSAHKDIHWVVLGEGRKKIWVENQIEKRQLQSNFHLMGSRPMESMSKYFALADVLLVSLQDQPIFAQTIPSKIQSYLACGKPVIASIRGSGSDVINESGAGVSVPPENPQKLADAVMSLYQTPKHARDKIGESGREYYLKTFERSKLIGKLESWMSRYLN